MPCLYIILSGTASRVGKMIRTLTRYPYNHVSVSLSKELDTLHTFARFRRANHLIGGYTRENIRTLSLGRKRSVAVKIFAVPVTEEGMESVQFYIKSIAEDVERYYYNLLVAFTFRGRGERTLYKTMTCMDFARGCLAVGGADIPLEHRQSLGELEEALGPWECYTGEIMAYPYCDTTVQVEEKYTRRYSPFREAGMTLRHMHMLAGRHRKAKRDSRQNK